jgi:RNA polymerase sigma factor (sigma-70 family)
MKAKYIRFTTEQILQCRQDTRMMEELIKNTQGLVYDIARKFFIKDLELEDLMSIGQVEVYKAVFTYNEELEANFYTYARQCIVNKYRKVFLDSRAKKRGGLGALATKEEIANEEKLVKRVVSIDAMSEEGESILDKLESSVDVGYDGTTYEAWGFLLKMKILRQQEYYIVRRVYADDTKLCDLADEFGVTRQRINAIHKRALGKIKERCTEQQLATLLGI